jgi:hypothetical protein
MTDVIATCIVLICGNDNFDMELIEEVERELNRRLYNRLLREG